MNDSRLVSVIIPAYNEATVAARCVDSVLAQTYRNIEVILVDDGSTDGTGDLFDEYARRDGRVKVIRQENAGPGAARNAGLAAAAGDFVQFVDSDDAITPGFTASLAECIGDADLALCGFRLITAGPGGIVREETAPPPATGVMPVADYARIFSALDDRVGRFIFYSQCNKLFRMDLIRRGNVAFRAGMDAAEDALFNLRYLPLCESVSVTDRVQYDYYGGTDANAAAAGNVYRPNAAECFLVVGKFFRENFGRWLSPDEMNRRLGSFANFMIIFMVNMARRDANEPGGQIVAKLRALVNSPEVRNWFRHYRPLPGQSRLVPLLVKWKLPRLLFVLARRKADKRYGSFYGARAAGRRGWRWFS